MDDVTISIIFGGIGVAMAVLGGALSWLRSRIDQNERKMELMEYNLKHEMSDVRRYTRHEVRTVKGEISGLHLLVGQHMRNSKDD